MRSRGASALKIVSILICQSALASIFELGLRRGANPLSAEIVKARKGLGGGRVLGWASGVQSVRGGGSRCWGNPDDSVRCVRCGRSRSLWLQGRREKQRGRNLLVSKGGTSRVPDM